MTDGQKITLSLIILLSAFLFNRHFSSDRVGTAEVVLNQDSLLRVYISHFHHNAKVEILSRKQTIDTINQCVYITRKIKTMIRLIKKDGAAQKEEDYNISVAQPLNDFKQQYYRITFKSTSVASSTNTLLLDQEGMEELADTLECIKNGTTIVK